MHPRVPKCHKIMGVRKCHKMGYENVIDLRVPKCHKIMGVRKFHKMGYENVIDLRVPKCHKNNTKVRKCQKNIL